jgi:hypothetical protein
LFLYNIFLTFCKLEEEKYDFIDKKDIKAQNAKKYKRFLKKTIKKITLDSPQIEKAAKVLKTYSKHKNSKNALNLLEEDDKFITVTICLSQVPTKYSPKPLQIPIPHPIYGQKYSTRACLFIKDPERQFLDKIEDLNLPCLAK